MRHESCLIALGKDNMPLVPSCQYGYPDLNPWIS